MAYKTFILQAFMFPLITLLFLKIIGNTILLLSKALVSYKEKNKQKYLDCYTGLAILMIFVKK